MLEITFMCKILNANLLYKLNEFFQNGSMQVELSGGEIVMENNDSGDR